MRFEPSLSCMAFSTTSGGLVESPPDGLSTKDSNIQSGLCIFRMEQCSGHWHFHWHPKESQNRAIPKDPVLREPQPARCQGAPGGQIKAGPKALIALTAFAPLGELCLTQLHSAGFKRHLTHSYSEFRNKRSAPLIRTPGVKRASDILRNAPST